MPTIFEDKNDYYEAGDLIRLLWALTRGGRGHLTLGWVWRCG